MFRLWSHGRKKLDLVFTSYDHAAFKGEEEDRKNRKERRINATRLLRRNSVLWLYSRKKLDHVLLVTRITFTKKKVAVKGRNQQERMENKCDSF